MIVFKNSSGFTLIEAMMAIALIAIVMTPLIISEGTIVQSVAKVSARLQRIFAAENFFMDARVDAEDKVPFALDKKVDFPGTKLSFERKQIDSKSSLAKIKNLVVDRIEASWDEQNRNQKEMLVSFMYKPQSSKS